jgi:N utilization substance protein A
VVENKKHTSAKLDSSLQRGYEILQVAEAVGREKGIDRDEILSAMEHAIQKTAKVKYGSDCNISASIDKNSGVVSINRKFLVVSEVINPNQEISLEQARIIDPLSDLGSIISEDLPPLDFGRVAAQSARQVITQKVRDFERVRQYEEFKGRVGTIINGLIKRLEFGNAIVELERVEAILPKNEMIPRESLRIGDRVRCLVKELKPESKGSMVILSRTDGRFMAKLFEQEVPEIYDGVISIKSVARDPGSRAKMSVYCADSNLDAVGSCVGIRGSRVQVVVNELHGEKVDIIKWSDNPATYVVNALAPAEILKIVIDEEEGRVTVVVAEDQLSLAIGRKGQNVKLASQLTNWRIDILTEEEDIKRRSEESAEKVGLFMEALDVDDMLAKLLVAEGFDSIQDIAFVDIEEFASIDGFDEDLAQELMTRAKTFLDKKEKDILEKLRKEKVDELLLKIDGVNLQILSKLCDNNIKKVQDLADLSGQELMEIIPDLLNINEANNIVMAARSHLFDKN